MHYGQTCVCTRVCIVCARVCVYMRYTWTYVSPCAHAPTGAFALFAQSSRVRRSVGGVRARRTRRSTLPRNVCVLPAACPALERVCSACRTMRTTSRSVTGLTTAGRTSPERARQRRSCLRPGGGRSRRSRRPSSRRTSGSASCPRSCLRSTAARSARGRRARVRE